MVKCRVCLGPVPAPVKRGRGRPKVYCSDECARIGQEEKLKSYRSKGKRCPTCHQVLRSRQPVPTVVLPSSGESAPPT